MSMAHGLEVRSPFLDTELLELRGPAPARGRRCAASRLKRVLKAAVADLLPREILQRGKRGFGVPLDRWFREDLRAYVAGTLGAPDARVRHAPGRERRSTRCSPSTSPGRGTTGTRCGRC